MIERYLRILKREKFHNLINISGLAIGFASCMIIFQFLSHELSYDKFHSDNENIYRVNINFPTNDGFTQFINSPPALASWLRSSHSEIDKVSQLRYSMRTLFTKNENQYYESNGYYADSCFFDIFDFNFKYGKKETALDEPNTIVMTEEMANKYFGTTNPIGETIRLNQDRPLKVTGILKPLPSNSHIQFDYLISFPTYVIPRNVRADLNSWRWLGFLTYVKLNAGYDPTPIQSRINEVLKNRARVTDNYYTSNLQQLNKIYLGSNNLTEDPVSSIISGNKFSILLLSIVAFLILVVAGFNYINLTIALYQKRRKEVGIKKIVGSPKISILYQLISESVLVTITSLAFAFIIYLSSFNYISDIFEWNMSITDFPLYIIIPAWIIIALIAGVLLSLYPSLMLLKTKEISVLSRNAKQGEISGAPIRNLMVVLQFSISVGLIIGTLVVNKQIKHLSNQPLGFQEENVIVLKMLPEVMGQYYESYKTALEKHPQIICTSNSGRIIGSQWPTNSARIIDEDNISREIPIQSNWVGLDYLKTMGIKMVEGRNFSKEFSTDSRQAIILNKKAVKELGLSDPVGTRVNLFGDRTVIGVVEDFNSSSLHDPTFPIGLVMTFIDVEYVYVRIAAGNANEIIKILNDEWNKITTNIPLDISFLDSHINNLYQKEQTLSKLFNIFSGIALFLACLGLYGLVSVMISYKLKEVTIRKVVGASVSQLLAHVSKKYFLLIMISNLIAFPLAFIAMNKWLENFAYKTTLSWWIFALAGVLAMGIALLTVSWQSWRAATRNPVEALRYE